MGINGFEYHAPSDLSEALDCLDRYGSGARPLAGGTDLLVEMRHGSGPKHLVWLGNLEELKGLTWTRDEVRIGSLSLHADLATDGELRSRIPILTQAVSLIGSWQIRNTATIGGNLCHGSPAADSAGPLLALEARVVLVGGAGERTLDLGDFFTGPGQTSVAPGEILKEVVVPLPTGPSSGRYLKLMRKKAVDLALLGVAVQAQLEEDGSGLKRVNIGLGGLAPTPLRASEAEALFPGLSPAQALGAVDQAAHLAVSATRPIDDVRASAEYRKAVTEAYVKKGLKAVLGDLAGDGPASPGTGKGGRS